MSKAASPTCIWRNTKVSEFIPTAYLPQLLLQFRIMNVFQRVLAVYYLCYQIWIYLYQHGIKLYLHIT